MDNTNTQQQQSQGQANSVVDDEMKHIKHEVEHDQLMLQALEALKDKPHLQTEIEKMAHRVQELQDLLKKTKSQDEDIVKHLKEQDDTDRAKAIQDAITRTHVEDTIKMEEAVKHAHEEDEMLTTKAVMRAQGDALQHAHKEDQLALTHSMESAALEVQHSVDELKTTVDHLTSMVESGGKSLLGHPKVKYDALLDGMKSLKQKCGEVAESFQTASKHASERMASEIAQSPMSPAAPAKVEADVPVIAK